MGHKLDYCLILLLVLSVIFIIYWTVFGNYAYTRYADGYYDLGVEAYSAYWHIYGIAYYSSPLQYLIFATHLSFSFILFLPFYAIYPQPITLFVIQASVLAGTSIVLYLISLKLLNSRKIALALALAFLVNPAVRGLLDFAFHPEMMIPLFYILSFYFYIQKENKYFIVSFVLLLGVLEVTTFVAVSLLAALFVYEIIYNRNEKEKPSWQLLGVAAILCVVFFAFYYALSAYLPNTYLGNTNAVVPPQRVYGYLERQISHTNPAGNDGSLSTTYEYGILGLSSQFTGFGLSSFLNPIISLMLYSPWWLEVVLTHFQNFVNPFYQYYSYGLGGSVVSALFGLILIMNGRIRLIPKKIYASSTFGDFAAVLILIFAIYGSIALLPDPDLFLLNYAPLINYSSIDYAITLMPATANVMTQDQIAPHMTYIRNLEMPASESWQEPGPNGMRSYWFIPDYILLNKNLIDYSVAVNSTPMNESNFTKEYTLYLNQSGTLLYKRIGG